MANTSTRAVTAHRRISPSPPTSLGLNSSARSDYYALIAQAGKVLALKHELIDQERQLLNTCDHATGDDLRSEGESLRAVAGKLGMSLATVQRSLV